jgi:hypothetical protein
MTVDRESPPGAWAEELRAAPWGYGQSQAKKVEVALNNVHKAGLWEEYKVINMELNLLKTELELLRNGKAKS